MIPSRLIFVWIGKTFPITAQAAIRSAWIKDKPQEILLIHEGLDINQPVIKELKKQCQIKIKEFNLEWFKSIPQQQIIQSIFETLTQPSGRSNIIRMIALWKWGGIYLDTDTITFRSLDPLRKQISFCGEEPVLIPGKIKKNPWTLSWIKIGIMLILRSLCSFLPQGYLLFKPLEKFCYQCVNNAIIGSIAKAPFLHEYFKQISKIPQSNWNKRFFLGTYALQHLVQKKPYSLTVYPSNYFYPLGPEICNHWFRPRVLWKNFLEKNCFVIHWYQSVESRFLKQSINQQWINKHSKTPFSQWFNQTMIHHKNEK